MSGASIAHVWHSGFTSADQHMQAVEREVFESLVERERLVTSKEIVSGDHVPDFLCMIYYNDKEKEWTLGGLMSSRRARGTGISRVVCCFALGKLIALENPFGRGEQITSYVAKTNPKPVALLKAAGFRKTGVSGSGGVNKYELLDRSRLEILSNWCSDWSAPLKHTVRCDSNITLPAECSFQSWKRIFDVQKMS